MAVAVLLLLAFLTYENLILVVWIFVKRLIHRQADEPKWRVFVLWFGLFLAATAVIAFWAAALHGPIETNRGDVTFRRVLRLSILMAAIALLTAINGKGNGRIRDCGVGSDYSA
jgi:peptidoglycan biosynthesis protein MviN/MurJ (putative lipid II flippase)